MIDSPFLDHDITVRVNIIRGLASGLVWVTIFILGLISLGLLMWLLDPNREWMSLILTTLAVGVGVFFLPISFLAMVLMMDFILAPVGKLAKRLGILGFILGIFIPTDTSFLPLFLIPVLIVGDPLVYLLWRISPSIIPVEKYEPFMFAPYIRVEKLSAEQKSKNH